LYSDLAYLIVGLPVLAFVLCLFFGWHLPRGGGFITVLATLGAFIISFGIFQEISSISRCTGLAISMWEY
jgi:F420H2 dehydrogenase subunit L